MTDASALLRQQENERSVTNKQLLLIQRPKGKPIPSDFSYNVQYNVPISAPKGGVFFQTLFISIDPAMRGWMSTARSYLPPVPLGGVMRAMSVGRVIASDVPRKFPVGTLVLAQTSGVQSYATVPEEELKFLTALPQEMPVAVPVSAFLGVLGITGLTAYFGFLRKGMPKQGDVVLVSGAAGATGSVVCQIAKIKGCSRVVGTAGSDEKCQWLVENGIVDVAINYKTNNGKSSLSKAIRNECPNGADIVFDNVGGEFLEAALSNLKRGSRIVLCGAISQYNSDNTESGAPSGPRNYMNLLVKRATMSGFVVFDYRREYGNAILELCEWIASGQLKFEECVVDGIENFYPALMSLFNGTNKGKVVLRVAPVHHDDSPLASQPRSKM